MIIIYIFFYRYILLTIVLGNLRSETCFFDRLVSLLFLLGNQKKCLYFKSSDRLIVPVFYANKLLDFFYFWKWKEILKKYLVIKYIDLGKNNYHSSILLANEVSVIFSPIRLYLCEFRILNGGFCSLWLDILLRARSIKIHTWIINVKTYLKGLDQNVSTRVYK